MANTYVTIAFEDTAVASQKRNDCPIVDAINKQRLIKWHSVHPLTGKTQVACLKDNQVLVDGIHVSVFDSATVVAITEAEALDMVAIFKALEPTE